MDGAAIVRQRLRNQQLVRSAFERPGELVAWMGAMQAQDYPGAKWGIGQRVAGANDAAVEAAFAAGEILRTHVMRPTWHFVAPADIRWLLALTGPRVQQANSHPYRRLELDARTLTRSATAIARALCGGRHLTRTELAAAIEREGIDATGQRLAYMVMNAELNALICSGPRRGNQFTYALLEERVPATAALDRESALVELTRRYLRSHGPATVHDYSWWSGLTIREARRACDALAGELETIDHDGLRFWSYSSRAARPLPSPVARLLPNYDELGIAYRDRRIVPAVRRPAHLAPLDEFPHLLTIDEQLAGRWKRAAVGSSMTVALQPFRRLDAKEARAVRTAAARYSEYLEAPVNLVH